MLVKDTEWTFFYADLKRLSGIDFSQYKQDQLQRRIKGTIELWHLSNLGELSTRLGNHPADLRKFLDKMAINVSEMYRNPEKWHELQLTVLPELLHANRRLKCWSAGCSYGAEAYTLAMILAESFSGTHQILGTDIDESALAQAREGALSPKDVRSVPEELRSKYLVQTGDSWRVTEKIRKTCSFEKGNILADKFQGGFDLIMCRNVVIYFNDAAKNELYEKFFHALRPGGVLFVGGTERVFTARQLGFESPLPFFYRKPTEGQTNKWRIAS